MKHCIGYEIPMKMKIIGFNKPKCMIPISWDFHRYSILTVNISNYSWQFHSDFIQICLLGMEFHTLLEANSMKSVKYEKTMCCSSSWSWNNLGNWGQNPIFLVCNGGKLLHSVGTIYYHLEYV